jgi:hypothetical protein
MDAGILRQATEGEEEVEEGSMSTWVNILLVWFDLALILMCLLHLGVIKPYIPYEPGDKIDDGTGRESGHGRDDE